MQSLQKTGAALATVIVRTTRHAAGAYQQRSTRILVRTFLLLFILAGMLGTLGTLTAKPVHADGNPVYTVDPVAAAGGVYARYLPHTADTTSTPGYGAYPYDQVELLCGVTDGDPVGPYNNHTWHYVEDLNNTGEGPFWLNDHYVDSPQPANQLAPGELICWSDTNPLGP